MKARVKQERKSTKGKRRKKRKRPNPNRVGSPDDTKAEL